jgi:hypothetical protein
MTHTHCFVILTLVVSNEEIESYVNVCIHLSNIGLNFQKLDEHVQIVIERRNKIAHPNLKFHNSDDDSPDSEKQQQKFFESVLKAIAILNL